MRAASSLSAMENVRDAPGAVPRNATVHRMGRIATASRRDEAALTVRLPHPVMASLKANAAAYERSVAGEIRFAPAAYLARVDDLARAATQRGDARRQAGVPAVGGAVEVRA